MGGKMLKNISKVWRIVETLSPKNGNNKYPIHLYFSFKIFQYNSIDSPVATLWLHHIRPVSCLTELLINTLTARIVILTPLTVQTREL